MAQDLAMNFGKHQGDKVCDVPTPYLQWAVDELVRLSPKLKQAMKAELEFRTEYGRPSSGLEERGQDQERPPSPHPREGKSIALADLHVKIRAWYSELALKHHPDRNVGDAAAPARFAAITEAYDKLRERLGL